MKQFSEEIRDVVTSRIFKTKFNQIFAYEQSELDFQQCYFED